MKSGRSVFVTIVVASFGFFAVGSISALMSPDMQTQGEILLEAESSVPDVIIPDKPQGRTISETKSEKVCNKVLTMKGLKIHIKTVCHEIPKTFERFVGPTDLEMSKWEQDVESANYRRTLLIEAEVKRLTDVQNQAFRAHVKDMIQIASGLFGMLFGAVGMYLAIRQDRRATLEPDGFPESKSEQQPTGQS